MEEPETDQVTRAEEAKPRRELDDAIKADQAIRAEEHAAAAAPPPPAMAKALSARAAWAAGRATFDAWLARTPEAALEPELEIVDPHHHVWDMRELMGHNLMGIFRQQYYMTDELLDDFVGGGHNVTRTVFVTTHAFFSADADPAMAPLGEVQFVQGVAAQFASGKYGAMRCCAGIVGAADLAGLGAAVEPLLLACKAASPNYRGVRCTAAHDPNIAANFAKPGMYAEPRFREGFALLGKHGLLFDAWVFACQLGEVRELAAAFPETTIVLNHAGTPVGALGDAGAAPAAYAGKQADVVAAWKRDMARLAAECPNVVVKVGGAALPALGHGFEARDAPPGSEEVARVFGEIYLFTIETFGPARCMLEGNFPVDKVAMSYTVLWNALKRITKDAGFSDEDRALLFSGTAKRVYRLS